MHNKEDECAVKDAIKNNEILKSRYENYIHFIEGWQYETIDIYFKYEKR